jgi:uncharacterized membrane protein
MDKKDVDEKDVDEKLIKWNDIFQELVIDAKTLTKDLSEGINYIAISAIIVITMGLAALIIGLDRGIRLDETRYIALGLAIFGMLSFNAALTLRKWHTLKLRYSRLQSLQRKMESS